MDRRKMEKGIHLLLEGMDVDLKDENFRETPARVARMYEEILSPQDVSLKTFPTKFDEMVVVRNHTTWGLCPHHLMPVKYKVSLGYLPAKRALGLSKLPRLVNIYTYKPLLQEEFTRLVVDTLADKVPCLGAGCIVRGEHGCMGIRGVRTDSDVITSAMKGVFLTKPEVRAEFLALLSMRF